MSRLIACTACARHVRVSESTCPFCASALDVDVRRARPETLAARGPAARVGRAALLAVGLGAAAPLGSACHDAHEDSVPAYGAVMPPLPPAPPVREQTVDDDDGAEPDGRAISDATAGPDAAAAPAHARARDPRKIR